MRYCPTCSRIYADETLKFCLDDGTHLVSGKTSYDPQATLIMPTSENPARSPTQPHILPALSKSATSLSAPIKNPPQRLLWILVIALAVWLVGLSIFMAYRPSRNNESSSNNANKTFKAANANSSVNANTETASLIDRLPLQVGRFKRTKSETYMDDYSVRDYGATESLRVEYDNNDIGVFLSKFSSSPYANSAMQSFARQVEGDHDVIRRESLKNSKGGWIGELIVLRGKGVVMLGDHLSTAEYLLATNGQYLYRIYAYKRLGDAEELYRSLPME